MTPNQTLVRIAASLARRAGFETYVSDAKTTASAYLYVMRWIPGQDRREKVLTLRVSDHAAYGRFGWHKNGSGLECHLKPGSPAATKRRLREVLAKAGVLA